MKKIITIGRQFASEGSEIAKKLSEMTEIPCYDRDALVAIAEKHGIDAEIFEKADERATSSFLYSLAMSSYNSNYIQYDMSKQIVTDKVFNIQSSAIKEIADKGDCIIVGRCADDILADYPGLLKIFIYAPIDHRIDVLKKQGIADENEAKKRISKMDKKRASYYNFYTSKAWGDSKNYHLNIDSSLLGTEGTAKMINHLMNEFYK